MLAVMIARIVDTLVAVLTKTINLIEVKLKTFAIKFQRVKRRVAF